MNTQIIIREIALLIIGTIGWALGYMEHRSHDESLSIRLPGVVRILIGEFNDRALSIRGVLIQFFMYILFLAVT